MRDRDDGEAIRAAFEEGYVQGVYHPRGVPVVPTAREIARAFWRRVQDARRERAAMTGASARCKAGRSPDPPPDRGEGAPDARSPQNATPPPAPSAWDDRSKPPYKD